jgi:N utilization substance protein A
MEGLNRIIDQVSKEKGISSESLQETVEQAMVAAARKMYGQNRDIEAQYNSETDEVELFEFKTVVDEVEDQDTEIELEDARRLDPGSMVGDELGLKMEMEEFGRIAAQTAKQVIIQRVRDSEREKIYDAYTDRVGELITGIVRRFEKGAIIVDLGKAEAVIPSREQVHSESYRQGDRIQAYILEVARNARGPQVVLSRTHPGLLVKLFEMEVPEIYEGIVTIEAAVREPGARAKIAVSSRDSDVDPVGACVGMKGSRVQAVVAELRGEKIDIIPYSMDPARFVCSAISPAIVTKVILDEDSRTMELIVPDDQLSLAIGRRGQNVRLAAQLTGWKIDIHSETRIREMNETARTELALIGHLNEDHRELLIRYGFRSIEDVADADFEDLMDTLAIEQELAEQVIDQADEVLTERMREKIAHDEENVRRVAAGLPTFEEVAEAERQASAEAEAERQAQSEQAELERQVAQVAAQLSGLKGHDDEPETVEQEPVADAPLPETTADVEQEPVEQEPVADAPLPEATADVEPEAVEQEPVADAPLPEGSEN